MFDAGRSIEHARRASKVGMTNASQFAYVRRSGQRQSPGRPAVLAVGESELPGFSPHPTPHGIRALRGADGVRRHRRRDRAVDESGDQLAVFGRRGAHTKAEMDKLSRRPVSYRHGYATSSINRDPGVTDRPRRSTAHRDCVEFPPMARPFNHSSSNAYAMVNGVVGRPAPARVPSSCSPAGTANGTTGTAGWPRASVAYVMALSPFAMAAGAFCTPGAGSRPARPAGTACSRRARRFVGESRRHAAARIFTQPSLALAYSSLRRHGPWSRDWRWDWVCGRRRCSRSAADLETCFANSGSHFEPWSEQPGFTAIGSPDHTRSGSAPNSAQSTLLSTR